MVDGLLRAVKLSPSDDLLGWLRLLVLMDDTVIVATTHEGLCQKLKVFVKWCNQSGMIINVDKTEYMSFKQ